MTSDWDNFNNGNIAASFRRMDKILNESDNSFPELKTIPSLENMTHKNGCYVPCISMFVDIRDSSKLISQHNRPVLAKIYRTFLSEIVMVMKSSKLCKHTKLEGDCVQGVFNAPPSITNKCTAHIFELAAKISSMIEVMNRKFDKKGYTQIRVGIGLSYGNALMVKAGYSSSGEYDAVWIGDVVNEASKLSNYGNKNPALGDEELMVSESFYEKLPIQYTTEEFLCWHEVRQCYTGKVYNTKINSLFDKLEKRREKQQVTEYLMTPSTPKQQYPESILFSQSTANTTPSPADILANLLCFNNKR